VIQLKKIALFFLLLVCSTWNSVQAQVLEGIGNTLLSNDEKSILLYFEDLGLLPENIDLNKSEIFKSVQQKISQFKLSEKFQNPLLVNGVDVKVEHFFYEGDSLNAFQGNVNSKHFSTLGINSSVSAFNTPIQVGGNLVLVDGKVDTRLSTGSINFDPIRYLNQWKQKFNPLQQFEEIFNVDYNIMGLNEIEKEVFKTDYLHTVFQQVIAHPKFRSYAKEKFIKNDSIFNALSSIVQNKDAIVENIKSYNRQIGKEELILADELTTILGFENEKSKVIEQIKTYNDSTFNKIQTMVGKFKQISSQVGRIDELKEKYNNIWEEKKDVSFESLKSVKSKVEEYSDRINFEKYNNRFKEFIARQEKLKNFQKILLYTKHLDLGFFSIQHSDQITNFLSLNGVRYAYENDRFTAEIAYGNQSLSSQFLPSIGSTLFNRHFGRRMLYARTGMKSSANNFQSSLTILKVDDINNPEDSLFVFPKKNLVVGWSGQAKIVEDVSLKTDVSLSDFALGTSISDDPVSSDNMAFSINGVFETSEKLTLKIEGGYFYNGKDYVSLGNPFLLTNRQGFSLVTMLSLLEDKFTIQGDIKLSKSLTGTDSFRDFQYLGELSYRFGKANTISARFIPNIFKQDGSFDNDVVATNNIYNIQANVQTDIKESKLLSIFNLTNLRSDIQLVDTIAIDARSYLYLQELLMLKNGNSMNLTFMTGVKDFSVNALTDMLFQLDGTLQFTKWNYNIGGQILKQQFLQDWQYGIVNRIHCKIFNNGFLNLNAVFRRTLLSENPQNSIQANVSLLYSIKGSRQQNLINNEAIN